MCLRCVKKLGVGANGLQFIFPQTSQLFFAQTTFSDKRPEDVSENRIAIVVFAIDLLTALGQIGLQVPEVRRLIYLAGHFLCGPYHRLKFPIQGSLKSLAGDTFFRL